MINFSQKPTSPEQEPKSLQTKTKTRTRTKVLVTTLVVVIGLGLLAGYGSFRTRRSSNDEMVCDSGSREGQVCKSTKDCRRTPQDRRASCVSKKRYVTLQRRKSEEARREEMKRRAEPVERRAAAVKGQLPDLQLAGAVSRANENFSCVRENTCRRGDIYGSIQAFNASGGGSVGSFRVKLEMQKADGSSIPIRAWSSSFEDSYNFNAVVRTPGFEQSQEGDAITVRVPRLSGSSARGPNTLEEIPAIIARVYVNETGQEALDAAKLVAYVDYGNAIAESNENNNKKEYLLSELLAYSPLPDVTVTNIEPNPVTGITMVTVTNNGPGIVSAFGVELRAMEGREGEGEELRRASVLVGGLASGASATVGVPMYEGWLAPGTPSGLPGYPSGMGSLKAVADPAGTILETNEDNNEMTWTVPRVDLRAQLFSVAEFSEGEYRIGEIRNEGTSNAVFPASSATSRSWIVRVQWFDEGGINLEGWGGSFRGIGVPPLSISPGERYFIDVPPDSIPENAASVRIEADPRNYIIESDETNNTAEGTLRLGPRP